MGKPNWVERTKECEFTETGQEIIKKVTFESASKRFEIRDIIDTFLKIIGVLGIVLPLWLFYKQREADRDKQKALFQADIYSHTATELHSLIVKPIPSVKYAEGANKLAYDLYPKIIMLNEKAVIDTFKVIKDVLIFSLLMSSAYTIADSIELKFLSFYNELQKKPKFDVHNYCEYLAGVSNELANSSNSIEYFSAESVQGGLFIDEFKNDAHKQIKNLSASTAIAATECVNRYQSNQAKTFIEHFYQNVKREIGLLHDLKRDHLKQTSQFLSTYTAKLDSLMIQSNKLLYD